MRTNIRFLLQLCLLFRLLRIGALYLRNDEVYFQKKILQDNPAKKPANDLADFNLNFF
jgi:hypothetical protein